MISKREYAFFFHGQSQPKVADDNESKTSSTDSGAQAAQASSHNESKTSATDSGAHMATKPADTQLATSNMIKPADASTAPANTDNAAKPDADTPATYEIQVQTGSEVGAGLDATVDITITGERGQIKEFVLKNAKSKNKDLFERNNLDVFDLKDKDVGKVN